MAFGNSSFFQFGPSGNECPETSNALEANALGAQIWWGGHIDEHPVLQPPLRSIEQVKGGLAAAHCMEAMMDDYHWIQLVVRKSMKMCLLAVVFEHQSCQETARKNEWLSPLRLLSFRRLRNFCGGSSVATETSNLPFICKGRRRL